MRKNWGKIEIKKWEERLVQGPSFGFHLLLFPWFFFAVAGVLAEFGLVAFASLCRSLPQFAALVAVCRSSSPLPQLPGVGLGNE
jgi:hypothetical protein